MVMITEVYKSASHFLKASDLTGRWPLRLTIKSTRVDKPFDDDKSYAIISFDQIEEELVLNVTNSLVISQRYGQETDRWNGCAIKLIVQSVPFQGNVVPAVRVEVPPGEAPVAAPVVEPPKVLTEAFGDTGDTDEDVPLW